MRETKRLETEVSTFDPKLSFDEVETYFRNVREKARNADFELKKNLIGLFAHQLIVSGKETLIKAHLPNPASIAPPTSWHWGHDRYCSFEINLDLNKPNEIILRDEKVEREAVLIAA